MSHFWHLNDYNSRSEYDNLTNDPIFLIYSLKFFCWHISILDFKIFKIQFHFPPFSKFSSPFCVIFWSVKYTFTCQRWHILSFFYRNVANFWYVSCFFSNLIPTWCRSHGLQCFYSWIWAGIFQLKCLLFVLHQFQFCF